jgi:hypothetical protein
LTIPASEILCCWLVAGTVFSIPAALFEAWVLLVEINLAR